MNSKPLISVVIPCYNDGKFLPETIDRLFQQTYKNFEVIIVNDGSTDEDTLTILDAYRSYAGIRVLDKENGRMSAARNYGVKHAKGSIIVTLDADDYFEPTFFQKAIDILIVDENVVTVSSYIRYFGLENHVFKIRGGTVYNFLFSTQCPACAMIRKADWDYVGGYDENMKLGLEDWEFYLRLTAVTKKRIHVIPKVLFFYRRTRKSTYTNDTQPNLELILDYLVTKNAATYLDCIKELILKKQVLYTEARISWQNIFKMIKNRLAGKYR